MTLDAARLELATAHGRAQLASARSLLRRVLQRREGREGREGAPDACAQGAPPRVLLTAFHRFPSVARNASAQILRALVPSLDLVDVPAASDSAIDDPARQYTHATALVRLGPARDVIVRAVVLPVHWDLAAALAIAHVDALEPDLVLMNGVAAAEGPLLIERGASNRAALRVDGSLHLRPRACGDAKSAVAVGRSLEALAVDEQVTLSLTFSSVERAAGRAIDEQSAAARDGLRFDEVVRGAVVAEVRDDNAYLCNQVAFLVDRAMRAPGEPLRWLRDEDDPEGVTTKVGDAELSRTPGGERRRDPRATPRGFLHWPSALEGAHVTAASEVLRAVIDAQLSAPAA